MVKFVGKHCTFFFANSAAQSALPGEAMATASTTKLKAHEPGKGATVYTVDEHF